MKHQIQGQWVSLPAVVRDASAASLLYAVPAVEAERLVPDAFEVVEASPGEAHVVVVVVDYRDNDLGDYQEVGVVFFVRPRGHTDAEPGSYIWKLPVNQAFTAEAGRTIWGFPKTVESIDFRYGDTRITCRLCMDGHHVLTLTAPRGGTSEGAEAESTGYSLIQGIPHRYAFTRGSKEEQIVGGGEGFELELGDHAIAQDLRRLGLPKPALVGTWTGSMRGSFGAPEKL